ncbi:MAG: cytochrome b N-terminal domain-containing protein [Desulforhopalus sp.]|jgi:ubiquinol-cytochrome c reductase cytochrome b subunit|nr:cytochrome b N-terminal domain-containing protein [Desulforhopalus sp.]
MWSLFRTGRTAVAANLLNQIAWRERPWGTWALINLYLSLLSGIVVGLQYDYATPFYSTSAIDLLAPYGAFFRSLHFYSSQFFFFCTVIHFCAVYPKTASYPFGEWLKLLGSLPLILLLLFTGYVLRGDNTGLSAGVIAEHILVAIPLLGPPLNDLLFAISETGLRKVYVHHVIALDFFLLVLLWKHLRIYRIRLQDHPAAIAGVLLVAMLITAPLEPVLLGVDYISGPWFFLGLQELLRYLSPLVAGVLIPCAFLAILALTHPANRRSSLFLYQTAFWLAVYTILTVIAWNR